MSSELAPAHWAGREIQQRDYYYFYKGLSESLEQERAQLKEAEDITSPSLLKFGMASKFGGTMGAAWQMKPPHLIELALDVDRLDKIDALLIRDTNGDPHPTHPDGMALILPKLKRLHVKYSVMMFRSFNEPTIRKWMATPEEQVKESRGSLLARLIGDDDATDADR